MFCVGMSTSTEVCMIRSKSKNAANGQRPGLKSSNFLTIHKRLWLTDATIDGRLSLTDDRAASRFADITSICSESFCLRACCKRLISSFFRYIVLKSRSGTPIGYATINKLAATTHFCRRADPSQGIVSSARRNHPSSNSEQAKVCGCARERGVAMRLVIGQGVENSMCAPA